MFAAARLRRLAAPPLGRPGGERSWHHRSDEFPAQYLGIHLLYGIFALVFLPFVYVSVLRGDDTNRAQWVLAFTTLFMFGIALRSISTSI